MRLGKAAAIGVAGALMMLNAAVAVFGHDWMAPAKAAGRKNPLPRSAATLEQGRTVYAKLCAECHGPAGRGDGPKASRTWPAPSDLSLSAAHPAGEIAWKIETGRGDMPAFKDKLAPSDIWALAHWIGGLKR